MKKEPIQAELTRNDHLDLNVIRDLTKPELSAEDTIEQNQESRDVTQRDIIALKDQLELEKNPQSDP